MSAGFMGNVNDTNLRLVKAQGKEDDYTGKDGLLYCGKCRQPKEVYFSKEKAALFGQDRRPKECACQKKQRIEKEIVEKEQQHLEIVEALKRRGFSDLAMRKWTFANDNGKCRQMDKAHFYVENWEEMKAGNIGYLLWGNVGARNGIWAGAGLSCDRQQIPQQQAIDCYHKPVLE